MNKRNLSIIIVLILLCILRIIAVQTSINSKNNTPSSKHVRPLPKIVTVKLNKAGFSPKTVIISAGSAVVWKNVSGSQETVNSDNYPTNQLHKELNFGIFNNGSSVVYTFTKPGIYGYHNQLHHEQQGKVIVTK
ncbi:MAG TPA: cupredoxin domain-containing protein [Candidatus Saccharimonadales bacterium]|nr:cupredoxin domain-containing protein [Candidatus Saccharimonadales bacterium]